MYGTIRNTDWIVSTSTIIVNRYHVHEETVRKKLNASKRQNKKSREIAMHRRRERWTMCISVLPRIESPAVFLFTRVAGIYADTYEYLWVPSIHGSDKFNITLSFQRPDLKAKSNYKMVLHGTAACILAKKCTGFSFIIFLSTFCVRINCLWSEFFV